MTQPADLQELLRSYIGWIILDGSNDLSETVQYFTVAIEK